MSTAVDPSWLPSTVAQSTAALVGIIGGLLVARFMSIDSEQRSLRARRAETEERLDFLSRTRDEIEAALLRRAAVGVLSLSSVVEQLLTPPPDEPLGIEAFMAAAGIERWSVDELGPFLGEAQEVIRGCFTQIFDALEGEEGEGWSWPQTRRQLNLPEDEWDELREEAHVQLRENLREQRAADAKRNRQQYGLFAGSIFNQPSVSSLDIGRSIESTYDATARAAERSAEAQRRTQANDDVERARFEFDLADRALRAAALPGNLLAAVWMLTLLTVVGLVLPVIALFALPSYDSYTWRLIVLVAFCVGIAALLIYLFVSATRLRPKDDATSDDETVRGASAG